jgi:hypothetical protein
LNVNAFKAVVLGIWIACSGAIGIRADADTPARDTGIEEAPPAAADTTVSAPCDSTGIEAILPLAGSWRAAETAAEEKQRLQAIDGVTEEMGRFRRGKARGRLAERTSPPPSLMIEIKGSKVTIASGDRRLELELGGSPIEVSGSEETAQASAKMECERLIVVTRSDEGERTTTYRADGTGLSMEVIMKDDRLVGPLKYVATYARME